MTQSLLYKPEPDDQQLIDYLLGRLADDDAERLDEMSIADDAVAWRLRIVEDELVDGYVRGALTGESLERFESFYLASPHRREKVNFAGSFLYTVARSSRLTSGDVAGDAVQGVPGKALAAPTSAVPSNQRRRSRWRLPPIQSWIFAAAAALLLVTSGALLLRDIRLRNGLTAAQNQTAVLESRARELERQLSDQSEAHAGAVKELDRVNAALAAQAASGRPEARSRSLTTAVLVLLPQTRASGPVTSLAVPPDADRVAFWLQLEANDFPAYRVEMKDPRNNGTVWRSGRLTPRSSGDRPGVSIGVPATLLKPQHYSFELTGLEPAGSPVTVGSYVVEILPR